ncbi:SNRPN upstream reading frame protein [Cricetulus griseus]|uniref:SNRPN upstream reading frame protein n=1 Tax=Cricetulus griseus TaxID=10029 RepID=A0A061I6Y9_CRIGR|nr:SNRPN upstream reading frame protein [Cricetulus griseus]
MSRVGSRGSEGRLVRSAAAAAGVEGDHRLRATGGSPGDRCEIASMDRLHLRRTTEQHVPEVEVQVKRRRTASLSNQECHQYPRRSQQQQQVPVVDFQAELRQAFLAETPRGG